jgi:hypothetical protein
MTGAGLWIGGDKAALFISKLLTTLQITGDKKQSEERAALFVVQVNLPC